MYDDNKHIGIVQNMCAVCVCVCCIVISKY